MRERRSAALSALILLPALLLVLPMTNCAEAGQAQSQPSPGPLLPLSESYRIRSFELVDGLPAGDVKGLAQTGDGYLYVATGEGLVRFDSYRFHQVRLSGFQSRYIRTVYHDKQDRLWVLSRANELGYIEAGRFHTLAPASFLRDDVYGTFWETDGGDVWVSSTYGLTRIRPHDQTPLTHFTTEDGLSSNRVGGIFDLPGGEQVVVTNHRLARVEASRGRVRFVPFGPQFRVSVLESRRSIFNGAGGLYLALADHILHYQNGRFTKYGLSEDLPALAFSTLAKASQQEARPEEALSAGIYLSNRFLRHVRFEQVPSPTEFLPGLRVKEAWQLRDDKQWFELTDPISDRSYLVRLREGARRGTARRKDGSHEDAFEKITLREQFDFDEVRCFLEDREGSLWVGTDRGLFQLAPNRVATLKKGEYLIEGFTVPVLQTRDSALWVGTWGGGVHRYDEGRLTGHYSMADDTLPDGSALAGRAQYFPSTTSFKIALSRA